MRLVLRRVGDLITPWGESADNCTVVSGTYAFHDFFQRSSIHITFQQESKGIHLYRLKNNWVCSNIKYNEFYSLILFIGMSH